MKLHEHRWEVSGARACVVAVHGLAAHGGWFEGLAARLVPEGISVVAVDLPGHGLTRHPAGRRTSVAATVAAVLESARAAAGRHPDRPLFLMGSSLGAALVLLALERCEPPRPRAAILLSPAFGERFLRPVERMRRARAAALRPGALFPTPLERGLELTRDGRRLREIRRDPLALRYLLAGTWWWAARITFAARRAARRARAPLLILLAREDPVVPAHLAQRLLGGRPGTTLRVLDAGHALELAPDLEGLAGEIREWMQRLGPDT
jgi:alpha-beta hydrolase superfamily lysophospholipase